MIRPRPELKPVVINGEAIPDAFECSRCHATILQRASEARRLKRCWSCGKKFKERVTNEKPSF